LLSVVIMLDAKQPITALSRTTSTFLGCCGVLVPYIASMFLSRRLCASFYVYFASLDDVRTQNELALLRGQNQSLGKIGVP